RRVAAIRVQRDLSGLVHFVEDYAQSAFTLGIDFAERVSNLRWRHRVAEVDQRTGDSPARLRAAEIVGAAETQPFAGCLVELHGDFVFRNVTPADVQEPEIVLRLPVQHENRVGAAGNACRPADAFERVTGRLLA